MRTTLRLRSRLSALTGLARLTRVSTAAAVAVSSILVPIVTAAPASAAYAPIVARASNSVTADALPTVQINGVAWSQVVVGNNVYVGGSFTNARPAGAAAGTNLTSRNNLLSYNITTGALNTAFGPYVNAQVNVVAVSPDQTRLYIGGDFTTVTGVSRMKIAAFDIATGKLVTTFAPSLNDRVKAILVTNNAVYVGGMFTTANGVNRSRLAAFDLNGNLLNWAPTADYTVNALVLTQDKSKVVVGGAFQTINGASAYGMGAVDVTTGSLLPWLTTNVIKNAGTMSAITSLRTDGTDIYGTGYTFGSGGNFEGAFHADGNTGQLVWLEDCHGDTYDVYPAADTVYSVSHSHYCGNIGAFPQTDPWTMHYGLSWSKNAAGTATGPDPYGYASFAGQPTPSMATWFPLLTQGSFTGQGQAGWTITGNNDYVVIGGEFPTANGKPQQGLVRYARSAIAPNKVGPENNAGLKPSVLSQSGGTARVAFQGTWDRDDSVLTYKVFRNGNLTTPVYTTTAASTFWNEPNLGFVDTGLQIGKSYSYRVFVYDAAGNSNSSSSTVATVTDVPVSAYANRIKADGASFLWRLGEATGTAAAYDSVGFADGTVNTGVTRGAGGAIQGDTDTASTFDGSATGFAVSPNAVTTPDTFTAQAWINTTTTAGGKIFGFGNSNTASSSSYDRHVYMTNDGKLTFGVYDNGTRTISSAASYNDGNWHQVTAEMSAAGMALLVDGKLVASSAGTTAGQPFTGYWRLGGDNLGGWNNRPSSDYFSGSIDEFAVYPTALSRQTVNAQWVVSGRTSSIPEAPADAYGKAVFNDNPLLFWRLGESLGTVAADRGPIGDQTGSYRNGVTLGAAGALNGQSDTAATFDGNDDFVTSISSYDNPTVYSVEAWFKTTSTAGGKIIGFGSSDTGTSGSYDRHVYLQGDGKVVFGTYTGQLNTTTTTAAYNDGQWHHMVASQGADGMKLYLDGALVGANPQTGAQAYSGFWKVGGDNTWGSAPYLNGTIDEVAVYNSVLAPAAVTNHYVLGKGIVANTPPTASFSTAGTGATVALNATGSTDPDGTIASYAWTFGDGQTATGATVSHTYADSGTYVVTLTVTDNSGDAGTTSKSYVATINQAPAAAFTASPTGLSVALNGSTSVDAEGPIAGYSWNFGDGTAAGTGATTSHAYTTAGTYTVTLTVTDAAGLTNSTSQSVTVAAVNQAPVAAFTAAPSDLTVTLDGTGSFDAEGPIAGYSWNFGDGQTAGGATTSHTYAAAGSYTVTLTVTDGKGLTSSSSSSVVVMAPPVNQKPVAAFTAVKAGLTVTVDGSTSTDPDGTVESYAWTFGDGGTAATATADHSYAAAGTYPVTLTVTDNKGATSVSTQQVTVSAPAPANIAPTAAFTAAATGLTVAVNGTGSTDSDGTVATWNWNFGDSRPGVAAGTATGSTPMYTYAAAGTYTVTLTVADNGGLTAQTTRTVTVTAPNTPIAFATDTFGRTTTSGLGTAETGGSWTLSGNASLFKVNGSAANVTMNVAGAGPAAFLNSVSAGDATATVDVAFDKVPGTSGTYTSLVVRRVGTSDYRVKVRFLPTGTAVSLTKTVNGVETILSTTNVATLRYAVGDVMRIRLQAAGNGAGATTLSAKVWKTSASEPTAWQASTTDSQAALQAPGGVGFQTYLSSSAANSPIVATVDNLSVTTISTP